MKVTVEQYDQKISVETKHDDLSYERTRFNRVRI